MKSIDYAFQNDFHTTEENKTIPRKIVIFYGNCHTTAIREFLQQYQPFTAKYNIIPIKAIQEVKDPEYFKQNCFSQCDVFIHQSIQKGNRYGEAYSSEKIIKTLKPSCRIISIPNVYHLATCFFPQYEEKIEWKNTKWQGGCTAFFRDSILDNAFKNGLTIKETIEQYLNPNFYNHRKIEDAFQLFIQKVKEREKDWDIKVSSFIERHYREERLFYDPNHPTPSFLMYIIRELLIILEVPIIEDQLRSIKHLKLNTYEMPITQSVYSTYKCTFPIENIRADRKGLFDNLTLKMYIKRYWLYEWQNDELDDSKRKKAKIQYSLWLIRLFPYVCMLKLASIIIRTSGKIRIMLRKAIS